MARLSPALAFTLLLLAATASGGAAQPSLPGHRSAASRIPLGPATTPPSGDTTGYWQQRADYTIVATLDEPMGGIHATGSLRYVNQSPDTLRELWVHQHLNAFRPASRWAASDKREGRDRFGALRDPDYAYERFTSAPSVSGRPMSIDYPLAPDSTVARLALPSALAPGDSVDVSFAWDARLSTVPRRQGRRGRSFDFAQWYPKVAVYDRAGWHPNALVPAGEFYGEFGTFDVTVVLADDQVVAATGVPVSGDPGWARVAANATPSPRLAANAYGTAPPAARVATTRGSRAVRWIARNVHHFAWSTSPGFRYEGTTLVRPPSQSWRFPIWDTISVHVLYRADAEADCATVGTTRSGRVACVSNSLTQWQNGRAVQHGVAALRWLEELYGDYPYPQLTIVKRLDGGGTEYPMFVGNGSASLGLTMHEVGHIYSYGILANNEWQSGWLDEGLTSYQTSLQQSESRVLLAARLALAGDRDPAAPADTALARQRERLDATAASQIAEVRKGLAEPMGTRADAFTTFDSYNTAVYNRASSMYQALHDVMGEEDFQTFLREYFAQWQFRHVDRWAMQRTAERTGGVSLEWFFDQWVHRTGTIDYAMRQPVVTSEVVDGVTGYLVSVQLVRVGSYRHPMPIGVRTASGWTVVRGNPESDTERVQIRVNELPNAVWLDPFGSTEALSARFYRLPLVQRRAAGR